ncbi:hypothetical protein PIB30_078284 [Stylosanthes scabra]|uniref:Disease resistance R13L4/SHOC-2-like LRR domain-containing protein n=1 Tax=Stylosanthes scabra TaxID=79078 RepID=A0ABU6QRC2_9FABA|nr:hypothetical protein [Stylosanthes scabra]
MRCFVLSFTLFLFLHTPSSTSSPVLPFCNHHDNSNLLHFKNSFAINTSLYKDWDWDWECSSYSSKIASWKNGTDCCEWDGVTCGTASGHVIGLDLSCSMLQGGFHLNSTLFHLTHLQQLNLAYNDFCASQLSSRIGDLVSLTHLNLSNSGFGGDIPSTISHLSKLLLLDLSRTYTLPDWENSNFRLEPSTWRKLVGNTTKMKELLLDGVDMSSIRETSLSLLINFSSSLLSLSLPDTELHGKFPSGILGLPNLEELNLFGNQELKGELPKSNWSTSLRILDLSKTAFSGQIPDSIRHLKSLNQLSLSFCQFDGSIPVSLWNLTQLTYLDLSGRLHGDIPSVLSNFKHLTLLGLSSSRLSGHIPDVFDNLTKLDFLDNLLHTWKSMDYIDLSFNKLLGDLPIPPYGIAVFSVSNNNFTGHISSTFCNASSLDVLILSHNNLSGTIPQCLGASPFLSILDLQVTTFMEAYLQIFLKAMYCRL